MNKKLNIINNQTNSIKSNIKIKISKDYGSIPKPLKQNSSIILFLN